MVTRMHGSNHFNSNAASRARTSSSLSKGSSHSTHTTVTARTSNPRIRSAVPESITTDSSNAGSMNNNSLRSTDSSISNHSRRMNRSSFRRTLMLQKTKRNNSEKQNAKSASTVKPILVEEREAGAGSPTVTNEELPKPHVEAILTCYGSGKMELDLYKDVLEISPKASDREIRIAYFRRGREILGDDVANKSLTATNKLDHATKSKFQAVSMAYEILSTPAWKNAYERQGGILKNHLWVDASVSKERTLASSKEEAFDPFVSSSPPTVTRSFSDTIEMIQTPTLERTDSQDQASSGNAGQRSALRKSSFGFGGLHSLQPRNLGDSRRASSTSVRWKDHVEELVFVKHPGEHGESSDSENDSVEGISNANGSPRRPVGGYRDADQDRFSSDPNNSFVNNSSLSSRGSIQSNGSSSRSRRRRNKPKIVIDSEELESHLKRMDNEAEKHFVKDFWDNFEESMDGILSLVDSLGVGGADTKSRKSGWFGASIPEESDSSRQGSIGRSLSHDMTISSENAPRDIQRSNSMPLPRRHSATSLDAISPSPLPVVSPDEKSSRTSPHERIPNSWAFQDATAKDTDHLQAPPECPKIISPIPTAPVSSPSRSNHDGSMASSIVSQQLFRPISPTQSEATEQADSHFVSPEPKSADNSMISSNAFELDSRLSELESVDLTELENPFRKDDSNQASLKKPSKEKKKKFKVSMMSRIRGSSPKNKSKVSKGQQAPSVKSNASTLPSSDVSSTVDDVFAGVEDISMENDPQPRYTMPQNVEAAPSMHIPDISIERSVSQMSDLSASVQSSKKDAEDPAERNKNPKNAAPSPTPSSALSASTKESLLDLAVNGAAKAAPSEYSSQASSTRESTSHSNQSRRSLEVEDVSGTFFDYFLGYASAVLTECANLGASSSAEYKKDFIGFFYPDTEVREQPSSALRRVPSECTGSTTSS